MKSFPAGWIPILIVVLLSVSVHADEDGGEKSKLIALENAWNQAQLHRDAKALDGLVSEKYIYTDYDGTLMNKKQFLADIADTSFRTTLSTNEDVQVFLYEKAAIVTGTYHTKGFYKSKPIDHWGRFTDTWLFEQGRWQCVATHTNLIKR